MIKIQLFFILFFIKASTLAQVTYDDRVYLPGIKSVEFYNTSKAQSFPVINLKSSDVLLLAFDDLKGGTRYLNYTIQHCDANWNPSQLSPTEYLQSFTDDRITDYRYSSNTFQKYTHYEVTFPNQSIIPKLSGNYLLKVYIDGDVNKMVLTRRFYVLDSKVSISASVQPSNNNALRQSNQKINFNVNYGGLLVQNPNTDIRALVLQNGRTDKAQMNTQPANIRGSQLIYNDVNTNDFAGGNEFRHFDLRSLKLNSDRVGRIFRDTANTVILLGDPNRNQSAYSFQYDNNGNFYILNQDGQNPKIDADYVHVYFSLAGNKNDNDGAAYIVGKFNNFELNEQSKMQFDSGRARFYTDLYLKQGVYDYEYIWIDKNTKVPDEIAFEGSYYETENDYQILVYFRRPGARYEELVGYTLLNTTKR
ncbi:uncharacterized protein DUF5103 [Mucilaginibacter gracilis]|uniref:Uncharacterized protein DUF5103 n=1 Tax=Mucilaginibacter gracilis TaxID=423350 RepID=A0A495J2U6_9SPHI|nr:DUF5103 domain-containing protein [Mucilaginibacter gracilis]RKR82674.1 uncharacterized protein DUF5103 [Mucilaginibacter gracilis]